MKNLNFKNLFNEDIKTLFNIFNGNNKLMLVGGCVRNFILNKEINDFDFATTLKPEEVIKILKNNNIQYLTVGIKFGTITAIINNNKYEITTLRNDINTNGRHTDVNFINSYLGDAKRRDFTFNALYVNNRGNLYDYFDGVKDLEKGIIRFIGEPEQRIQEDYLRILRFFRFYSYYAYTFDYKSFLECTKYKDKINQLSKERIKYEFLKILNSNYPVKILKIFEYNNILKYILDINYLNLYNLEIFCSIKQYINYSYNNVFVLALICINNQINNIKYNLALTNNENNFIKKIIKYKDTKIDKDNIRILFFELRDKDLLKNIIIVNLINHLSSNYVEEINKYLIFVNNLKTIQFPVTIEDLQNLGISKDKYNYYMKFVKEYFIEKKLVCKKEEILDFLQKSFKCLNT